MDSFFKTVSQFTGLSEPSRKAQTAVLHKKEFPKGKVLVQPDMVASHLYFIENGLTRTYYTKDGIDVYDLKR